MAQKIFIDTDIGDDVDDALAIALALRSPELEVVGISTVYRNAPARQALAEALLHQLGRRDIPVAAGSSQTLSGDAQTDALPPQCRVLSGDIRPCAPLQGVRLLLDTLRREPDTVIVPIGPMTNIALAALLEPELMRGARIVAMGGAFGAVYPEYNILCDPEAAQIVLRSGAKVEMLGLDVTVPCVLDNAAEQRVCGFTEGSRGFLSALSRIWMETSKSKKITLHDPLVIAYLVDPTLVTMEAAPIRVVLEHGSLRGLTMDLRHPFRQREPLPEPNAEIAVSVDRDRACSMILERIFADS